MTRLHHDLDRHPPAPADLRPGHPLRARTAVSTADQELRVGPHTPPMFAASCPGLLPHRRCCGLSQQTRGARARRVAPHPFGSAFGAMPFGPRLWVTWPTKFSRGGPKPKSIVTPQHPCWATPGRLAGAARIGSPWPSRTPPRPAPARLPRASRPGTTPGLRHRRSRVGRSEVGSGALRCDARTHARGVCLWVCAVWRCGGVGVEAGHTEHECRAARDDLWFRARMSMQYFRRGLGLPM